MDTKLSSMVPSGIEPNNQVIYDLTRPCDKKNVISPLLQVYDLL